MLKVAGMARSTYYYRLNSPQDKYAEIKVSLRNLFHKHKGRYGYRRLTAALRNEDIIVNHKTVRKLMKQENLVCKIRQKRKWISKPSPELAASPNILNRKFKAEKPFTKGVTDVTEFYVRKQKVYVSAILDLYDGSLISMVFSQKNNTDLVMSMFEDMPKKVLKQLDNMLLHSDQGILYRTVRYHDFVRQHNITQSMSHRGNCYDNALMESFFGTFKVETIKLEPVNSLEELTQMLKEYGEYYNKHRIKSTLGYKSPYQYRRENGFEKYC